MSESPYWKQATKTAATDDASTREVVCKLLARVREGGEEAVKAVCKELDNYEGDILLSKEAWDAAIETVPEQVQKDIKFAHARVKMFAEKQRDSLTEFEIENFPGNFVGQKVMPIATAGCYVPGGLYAHIASAIMTVTTARVAGVSNVIVASPPRPGGGGVDPAILYTARLCGADAVLCCGGAQAIATLCYGLFTGHAANVLVGPGNKYVAEAKRTLFGGVGIDVIAGPTEIGIIADDSADSHLVATDLVSQAEHGPTSPCWLFTTSKRVAGEVMELMPRYIDMLPEPSRAAAAAAWNDYGEVYLASDKFDCARTSDSYAPEHLEVHCEDLDWWLANLRAYGSLFLGGETCVTYGDKCSGPNHVLPTRGAGGYTGGLNVQKFLKVVTYQRMTKEANREMGQVAARISRAEGMEGHARAADARLAKYSADEEREQLLGLAGAEGRSHVAAWLCP